MTKEELEKEAEEIANKRCHEIMCYGHCSFSSPKHHRCGEWHREYNCAKEGIEFGYNKANEWHYPSKGEYPKDEKNVLCILGEFENSNLEVGYYSQKENERERWRFSEYRTPDDSEDGWGVSAWKEIVLPELKEIKEKMTKEELKQKAYEYAIKEIPFIECITQNDLEILVQQAYITGAESREKRIAELEAQIEKMKKYIKACWVEENLNDYSGYITNTSDEFRDLVKEINDEVRNGR